MPLILRVVVGRKASGRIHKDTFVRSLGRTNYCLDHRYLFVGGIEHGVVRSEPIIGTAQHSRTLLFLSTSLQLDPVLNFLYCAGLRRGDWVSKPALALLGRATCDPHGFLVSGFQSWRLVEKRETIWSSVPRPRVAAFRWLLHISIGCTVTMIPELG